MSLGAARTLVEKLDKNIDEADLGEPHFSDSGVKVFALHRDGFRSIKDVASGRKLAFIDGGNREIIGAPNFSTQLNRVYLSVWKGKERVIHDFPKVEFFSATFSDFREGEIFYDTSLVPGVPEYGKFLPDEADLSFNSFDRAIMDGRHRADIERVASISRRFAEWKIATLALDHLDKHDVLIMDGTLQTSFPNEANYVQDLMSAAGERGVIVAGLSKTSAMFTTTGLSLMGAIGKLAEDHRIPGEWYLQVAESTREDHSAAILVVKLNSISERIFRFEIDREQFNSLDEQGLNEILAQLRRNSADATFPGYPYGLIDADRFARVSSHELEYYRGIMLSQISGIDKLAKFGRHVRSKDAHGILNTLIG